MDIDIRQAFRDMVSSVREKLKKLPQGSCIREAFSDDMLDGIILEIETKKLDDFRGSTWPPLFCFIERNSVEVIVDCDDDVGVVIRHSKKEKADEVYHFLKVKEGRADRYWVSGLFEVFVKSRFLRQSDISVELDYALSNGRNVDVRAEIDDKKYCFECSIVTESDEDRDVWDKYIEQNRREPNFVLVRPGQLDPPESKSPSPYYDCVRFYDKVYDKLSKNLNPTRSQMCEDLPNTLLISFHAPRAHLNSESMGIGWALDELFADQPRERSFRKSEQGAIDTSLLGWLQFKAENMITNEGIGRESFNRWSNDLIRAPRRIGAMLLFDNCSLERSRMNYNAEQQCQLSHKEMAKFEEILRNPPSYCS